MHHEYTSLTQSEYVHDHGHHIFNRVHLAIAATFDVIKSSMQNYVVREYETQHLNVAPVFDTEVASSAVEGRRGAMRTGIAQQTVSDSHGHISSQFK